MRSRSDVLRRTIAFILAGGEGRRLDPLTRVRPKPLVSFGGIFRLADITLSNCHNSGLRNTYVALQHKSEALEQYLWQGWNSEVDGDGHSAIPCPPRPGKHYRGTADAIYQNIFVLQHVKPSYVLILSAGHVYRMDYRDLLSAHVDSGAEVTIAAVERPAAMSAQFGVLRTDSSRRIVDFEEKPACPKLVSDAPPTILASMGIYVFNTSVLIRAFASQPTPNANVDFARDIIPSLLRTRRVHAYGFGMDRPHASRYWRDVGTINSYYDAGMELLDSKPLFDLYEYSWPIRSGEFNRGTRHLQRACHDSIISSSAHVKGEVHHSVVSSRAVVEESAVVRNSILLPGARVGKGAVVNGAILDEHAHVGADDTIGLDLECDRRRFPITDRRIVVVPHVSRSIRGVFSPECFPPVSREALYSSRWRSV